jgi:NhaP-type Na+/H+ or K+/H+ antiporter
MNGEQIIAGLGAILAAGFGAQWAAWRFRIPSILLLLCFGVALGPVLDWIDPDALLGPLLMPVVSISVAVILFEGSLSLRFRDIPVLRRLLFALLSSAVLAGWPLIAWAAHYLLGLGGGAALLVGAVWIVTGPTVFIRL